MASIVCRLIIVIIFCFNTVKRDHCPARKLQYEATKKTKGRSGALGEYIKCSNTTAWRRRRDVRNLEKESDHLWAPNIKRKNACELLLNSGRFNKINKAAYFYALFFSFRSESKLSRYCIATNWPYRQGFHPTFFWCSIAKKLFKLCSGY